MLNWHEQARCAGNRAAVSPTRSSAARRFCLGCPAMEICVADALVEELGTKAADRYGIRGSYTPSERVAIERRLGNIGVVKNMERVRRMFRDGLLVGAT